MFIKLRIEVVMRVEILPDSIFLIPRDPKGIELVTPPLSKLILQP